ncbi:hypothetical protein [Ferruginibacter sp. HRS2-29]|uniref:hypothetical protein n=1 Tax=Ferruginibacter sp. HRS2-29 TaxID=2487334 RepID=UPI0020CDFA06|nr:hypothetical protein [Ferruginibacter sp. HRS2-29]MCP9751268.1 hypothetical protein [Ferruginibacter sp. HRS2-29]
MKLFSSLLLILLFFCGCKSGTTETSLLGTWRLYGIEGSDSRNKNGDSFEKEAALNKIVKDGAIISFFEDNSYTDLRGEKIYKGGKYKFSKSDNTIAFIDSGETTEPVDITLDKNAEGKLQLIIAVKSQQLNLKFLKEAKPMEDFKSDPFYPANNTWRIKPAKAETKQAITSRMKNYIKHMALIMKAAKERKVDVVMFGFSMGPVKIYDGGIGIHPYAIVPDRWKRAFYDDVDAYTAYLLFENYLTKSRYRGASTGWWIEDDYNILLSIYEGLGKDNE